MKIKKYIRKSIGYILIGSCALFVLHCVGATLCDLINHPGHHFNYGMCISEVELENPETGKVGQAILVGRHFDDVQAKVLYDTNCKEYDHAEHELVFSARHPVMYVVGMAVMLMIAVSLGVTCLIVVPYVIIEPAVDWINDGDNNRKYRNAL